METGLPHLSTESNNPRLAECRTKYRDYLQVMDLYEQKRAEFRVQQQRWRDRHLSTQMMREDLERVKLELAQRRHLTKRPF